MTIKSISIVLALAIAPAFAQTNLLTQTTLSAAATATDRTFSVTSATGINAPSNLSATPGSELYIIDPGFQRGEVVLVRSVSGTTITVARGRQGAAVAHISGAIVLIGQPNWFYSYEPSGACTTASTNVAPWVNTQTGNQWVCSSVTLSWVAGFNNDIASPAVGAAVASAAAITPTAQLFHMTGTTTVTSVTLPVGFAHGSFTIIPDGIASITSGNNIASPSTTTVVGKPMTFTYDSALAKFYTSY